MLFAPREGGTSIKKSQKEDRGRKARTFCYRKTGFVHSRSGTYCFLLLGYFGLKFLPDIRHCFYWVLAEIWAPDSSHKIRNKFPIHHYPGWKEGSFVYESVWFFSGWILIRLTWNLSRFVPNSLEILTRNFRKKPFLENFSEILCKPRLSLAKLVKFRLTFCNLFPAPYCAEKIRTSPFVCCLHPGKEARP